MPKVVGRCGPLEVSSSDDRHQTSARSATGCAWLPCEGGHRMRIHTVGRRPATRMLTSAIAVLALAGLVSGVVPWCWTQAACLVSLRAPMRLPAGDAATCDVAACHPRWLEHAVPCVSEGSRASGCAGGARLRARRLLLAGVALLGGVEGLSPCALVAGRLAVGEGAAHHRAACRGSRLGALAHVGGADRPAPAMGAGASLGPPLPRRDRTGAGTDVGG